MREILLNNPQLESLELIRRIFITDNGLRPLHELKKLRKLDLGLLTIGITKEFLGSLGDIRSLQCLKFESLGN